MENKELKKLKMVLNAIYTDFSKIAEVIHVAIDSNQSKMELSGIFFITFHRKNGKDIYRTVPLLYGSINRQWEESDLLPFLAAVEGMGFKTIYLLADPNTQHESEINIQNTSATQPHRVECVFRDGGWYGISFSKKSLWQACLSCENDIVYHDYDSCQYFRDNDWYFCNGGTCPTCGKWNYLNLKEPNIDIDLHCIENAWGTEVGERWLDSEEK